MNIATVWHDTVEPETPQDRIAKLQEHKGLLLEIEADVRKQTDELSSEIAKLHKLELSEDQEL